MSDTSIFTDAAGAARIVEKAVLFRGTSDNPKTGRNVLLVGAPGTAKTSVANSVAAKIDADLITSVLVTHDETETRGYPRINEEKGEAEFFPFGDLAKAMRATRNTIWLLDDFSQASREVQASFMALLLARELNGKKLPDCVSFVATANRREDRSGAAGILEAVKGRFTTIIEVRPDVDGFTDWAAENDIHETVIAAINSRLVPLFDHAPSPDLVNQANPRTWEAVSDLLHMGLEKEDLKVAIPGAVGPLHGPEFLAYMSNCELMPNVDAILSDPDSHNIADETPSVMFALVTSMARKSNRQNLGSICRFAERCSESARGEHGALLMRLVRKINPHLVESSEWANLAVGPVGKLMSGDYR